MGWPGPMGVRGIRGNFFLINDVLTDYHEMTRNFFSEILVNR